jgi:hypothetical protein
MSDEWEEARARQKAEKEAFDRMVARQDDGYYLCQLVVQPIPDFMARPAREIYLAYWTERGAYRLRRSESVRADSLAQALKLAGKLKVWTRAEAAKKASEEYEAQRRQPGKKAGE